MKIAGILSPILQQLLLLVVKRNNSAICPFLRLGPSNELMYKSMETLYDGPQDPIVVNKLLWTAGAPSRMKLTNAQALLD